MFTIPASTAISDIQVSGEEAKKRISSWVWDKNTAFGSLQANESEFMPELTPNLIKKLRVVKPLPIETRIDQALRVIGRPLKGIIPPRGQSNDVVDHDHMFFMAAAECGDFIEMRQLLRQLKTAGLVTDPSETDTDDRHYYFLSLKGLNRLETGGDAAVSNTAFVAMWFGDEVKKAYKDGIAPAIRKAGYEPLRADDIEHSVRIDDRIVAEIRRARFLVCDFTCGIVVDQFKDSKEVAEVRGGVYYETGLAHGLGKPVIWTCRSDPLGHVHFDLRQYNVIQCNNGEENKLQDELFNRIRAVIT